MADLSIFDKPGAFDFDGLEAEVLKSPEQIRWEWLCKRRGYVTASNYATLMTYPEWMEEPLEPEPIYLKNGSLAKNQPKPAIDRREMLPTGAITYLNKVVSELMTKPNQGRDSGFTSFAMQWGTNTELLAVEYLDIEGLSIVATGLNQEFIKFGEYFGGTADGRILLVNGDKPLEVKCPNSDTHAEYLLNIRCAESLKTHKPNYYWQLLGNAQALETDSGLFVSFDPDYHDDFFVCHRVWCNFPRADFELLETRQALAVRYIENRLAQFELLKVEITK
jgi:hypothetical protein